MAGIRVKGRGIMKTLISAAIVAACLSVPAAAAGPQQQRTFVVTGTSVAHWVDRVSQRISARLHAPVSVQPTELDSGSAAVTFRCDGTGRPTTVVLARRSGYPMLDQIALRTIRNMPSLGPLPASFATDQRFRANIIFAQTQADYDEQLTTLRREAATARVAAGAAPAGVEIALNAASIMPPKSAN
jgi:TonB family protein